MARRGPDGEGEWWAPDGSVGLGHRRLAILDLTAAAAQPMSDPTGRYRIVFNGEIYNFRELRSELERDGIRFSTASDTEVILALWAREGERALGRLRGMFALALHDSAAGTVTLARDPFGIKPLYYAWEDGLLRFASQVRALEAAGLSGAVDPGGLVGFLLWGSVPEPWTIRRDARALPAGGILVASAAGVDGPRLAAAPAAVFDAESPASSALAASVRAHLVSDVPVAVFLSAGLDSALVATLAMQEREGEEPLESFTVAFEGWEGTGRDEAPLAARVAAALGTRHRERRIGRSELAAAWPAVLAAMDQPSIDGFNTHLVARAAHEAGIKVALSGLGGDELFGSYPSFRDVPRWNRWARALRAVPGAAGLWPLVSRAAAADRPKLAGLAAQGGSLAGAYHLRRGLFLASELPGLIGAELASEGLAAHDPIAHAERALEPSTLFGDASGEPVDDGDCSWLAVQRLERNLYLRNQLLRDSDWAAMASSLELRVPLVDVRLWRALRQSDRPTRRRSKVALVREALGARAEALPAELWSRPKSGFAVPVADWMLPPAAGGPTSAGAGSRRLALRLLEEWGLR